MEIAEKIVKIENSLKEIKASQTMGSSNTVIYKVAEGLTVQNYVEFIGDRVFPKLKAVIRSAVRTDGRDITTMAYSYAPPIGSPYYNPDPYNARLGFGDTDYSSTVAVNYTFDLWADCTGKVIVH